MAWKFPFRIKKQNNTDALWMKCENCNSLVYKRDVEALLECCPECDWHFRIDHKKRIEQLLDDGQFEELFPELESTDPLTFRAKKAYKDKLKAAMKSTGQRDAAVFGVGSINGAKSVFGVIDPTFIMGAMGSVTGEKIARAAEYATEHKLPLVLISGSGGGARMEEGVLSLMQMAKSSAALGRFKEAGGLYVVVLTNATMGGSMASFASLGDVIVAEPMALLGFTGPRVIQQTIKTDLPEGFQTSEFLLEHGFIDRIVRRTEMREYLGFLLTFFTQATDVEKGTVPAQEAAKSMRMSTFDSSELVVMNTPPPEELNGTASNGNGNLQAAAEQAHAEAGSHGTYGSNGAAPKGEPAEVSVTAAKSAEEPPGDNESR